MELDIIMINSDRFLSLKKLIVLLVFIANVFAIEAQIGKEFWFVAPDITFEYGDEPLIMRITTFDYPANITISMPANSSFSPISFTVAANTQYAQVLSKDDIENTPANSINNKGLLITSDVNITAYYEVANGGNPEKFTLKGNNAIGLDFMIPSQNVYGNWYEYSNANEKADIVATEDNTVVTITPTVDITGHGEGETYTITLNKGQTYCIENRDISVASSLAGTRVSSDKPIAITISDDSVYQSSVPRDLIGDQLVPISVIGTAYIAVKASQVTGSSQFNENKVFITAIEDGTSIYVDNAQQAAISINVGEVWGLDITDENLYINATKPIYAYQVSGLVNVLTESSNELGSAVLPSINCSGSDKVAFTRTFAGSFYINVVVKKAYRSSFVLKDNNGNEIDDFNNDIKWSPVNYDASADDTDEWYTGVVNATFLTTGTTYTLENTDGLFHLSILEENDPSGGPGSVSYACYTSYLSSTEITANASLTDVSCFGEENGSISLEADDGTEPYDYLWSDSSTDESLSNLSAGTYDVTITDANGCKTDESYIVSEPTEISITATNTNVSCTGDSDGSISLEVEGGVAPYSYLWSNGSTDQNQSDLAVGEYDVTVTDANGCSLSYEAILSKNSTETLDLSLDKNLCFGTVVEISAPDGYDVYEWTMDGSTAVISRTSDITTNQEGIYLVKAFEGSCIATGEISVEEYDNPQVSLPYDFAICDNEETNITVANAYSDAGIAYMYWNDNAEQSITDWENAELAVTETGRYSLTVVDNNGCMATDDIEVTINESPNFTLDDAAICSGEEYTIEGPAGFSSYAWNNGSTSKDLIVNTSGSYVLSVTSDNGCTAAESCTIIEVENPSVEGSVTNASSNGTTDGSVSITVTGGVEPYSYSWSNGVEEKDLTNIIAGSYNVLVTDANGCFAEYSAEVGEEVATVISELNAKYKVKVYPNPATGYVYLSSETFVGADIHIGLYSIMGVLMQDYDDDELEHTTDKVKIKLPALSNGHYIITTEVNGEILYNKIVVNN